MKRYLKFTMLLFLGFTLPKLNLEPSFVGSHKSIEKEMALNFKLEILTNFEFLGGGGYQIYKQTVNKITRLQRNLYGQAGFVSEKNKKIRLLLNLTI